MPSFKRPLNWTGKARHPCNPTYHKVRDPQQKKTSINLKFSFYDSINLKSKRFNFQPSLMSSNTQWTKNEHEHLKSAKEKSRGPRFHKEGRMERRRVNSACATKFCHRHFVLKYVVIGEKKDFQEESGLFRDLFWSRSGPFVVICTKMQNCLKL